MESLRKKLNSSQGASILLAMLFLLVCMMVGASVLMAAASNAGKIRSSREEQQNYLTLSSALTLVCDELTRVEYHGRYTYKRIEHTRTETDEYGNEYTWTNYEHQYTQEEGSIRAAGSDYISSDEWTMKAVLPLVNDLDAMFAENLQLPASKKNPLDLYPDPKKRTVPDPKSPHTLELTVHVDAAYGGLTEPVRIKVGLRTNGGIVLTAQLKNHEDYIMEAVLTVSGKPSKQLLLDSHGADGIYETGELKWTMDRIVKKEA